MRLTAVIERAVKTGATSLEVSRVPLGLRWYRGKELLAKEPLSIDQFTAMCEELRGLGARGDRASIVDSPLGGTFQVKFSNIGALITFADATPGEEAFAELLARSFEIRATHVICTHTRAEFKHALGTAEEIPLVDGAFEALAGHGRRIAGITGETGEGTTPIVFSGEQFKLTVLAEPYQVTFAVTK
jgi:hypothetical protein